MTPTKKITNWSELPQPIQLFHRYFLHNDHLVLARSVGTAITLDGQGRINVQGDVRWRSDGRSPRYFPHDLLPVQFGRVTGSFNLNGCRLISGQGLPQGVGQHLHLQGVRNIQLQDLPHSVGGNIWLSWNPQWSLLPLLRMRVAGKVFFSLRDPDQEAVLEIGRAHV